MCKVSIIVPIYKVEQYLESCLESIRVQSVPDFEVIMVNDGSPDNCEEICYRYVNIDKRFKYFKQENMGVTAARRVGVSHSCGKYLFFVDSDDTIPKDSLKTMLSHASDEYDIIVAQPDNKLVSKTEVLDLYEYRRKIIYGELYLGLTAKLFIREIFDEFVFSMSREIKAGEDWISVFRLSFNTEKKVLLLPDVVYNYDMRPTGVSATIKRTVEHEKKVYESLLNSVPESGKSVYFPMIAHAYTSIWVKYTKRMVKLSAVAESFRNALLHNLGSSFSSLSLRDRLFLKYKNPIVRFVLFCVSRLNGVIYSLVAKISLKRFVKR